MAELTEKECVKRMIEIQMELNTKIYGEDWVKGFTKNKKEINWKRHTRSYLNSFINKYDWHPWIDKELVVIEREEAIEAITLIYITIISKMIVDSISYKVDIDTLIDMLSSDNIERGCHMMFKDCEPNASLTLTLLDDLIIDTYYPHLNVETSHKLHLLMDSVNVNFKDIYDNFILKGHIVRFRYDNGYPDNYVKTIKFSVGEDMSDKELLKKCIDDTDGDVDIGLSLFEDTYWRIVNGKCVSMSTDKDVT